MQIGLYTSVQSFYIKKLAVSQIMKSEAAYLGLWKSDKSLHFTGYGKP